MLPQPDPHSPNRLQRFACLLLFSKQTNPATSYLGLFWCSVSIQTGSVVKSELEIAVTFVEHGQRLLSAGLERAVKNTIMNSNSKLVPRTRRDQRLHFQCVAF